MCCGRQWYATQAIPLIFLAVLAGFYIVAVLRVRRRADYCPCGEGGGRLRRFLFTTHPHLSRCVPCGSDWWAGGAQAVGGEPVGARPGPLPCSACEPHPLRNSRSCSWGGGGVGKQHTTSTPAPIVSLLSSCLPLLCFPAVNVSTWVSRDRVYPPSPSPLPSSPPRAWLAFFALQPTAICRTPGI